MTARTADSRTEIETPPTGCGTHLCYAPGWGSLRLCVYGAGVVPELKPIKTGVKPVLFHQLVMSTLLGHFAVRNNGYHIRISDSGKSVRHNNGGPPAAKLVKRLLDKYLRGVVKSRGRLVKNKYRRVFKEYSCNAYALLLTAGKAHSALAYLGVVAVLKRHHPIVYVGAARRFLHLGVGGVQLAVKDIVAYAAVEQKNVLLNYSDVAAQRVKR